MIKNMGHADKLIRLFAAAIILAILYLVKGISPTMQIILGIVAGILALTSLLNFCPLYKILGINTCKR